MTTRLLAEWIGEQKTDRMKSTRWLTKKEWPLLYEFTGSGLSDTCLDAGNAEFARRLAVENTGLFLDQPPAFN